MPKPKQKYVGRSINKLQNSWKFWNLCFVGNLILSTRCEFYYDDVTVTSFINIRQGRIAVESIPWGTKFCYSFFSGQKDFV